MTDIALLRQSYLHPRVTALPIPNRRARESGVLDLSRNELIHPRLDPLLSALLGQVPGAVASRYPIYSELIVELAAVLGCQPDELEIFPGSDDAIGVVVDAFATRSGSLLLQDPTYPAYQYQAQLRGVHVLAWPPRPGELVFAPEDAVRALRRVRSSVLVVTDPHGMLGRSLDEDAIVALAATADAHGHLMVIDECYAAFRGSARRDWRDFDNVIRLGTLSKAAGMAGLRLGYVIGAPTIVHYLRRWRRAAAVSGVAGWIAVRLLRDHAAALAAIRAEVIDGREWLAKQVVDLDRGLTPLAGDGNFLAVDTGSAQDASALARHLADNGVLVRTHGDHASFASLLQITAAPAAVLQQVVAALGGA